MRQGNTCRLSGKLLAATRLRFSRLMSLARTAGEAGCTFLSGGSCACFGSEPWNKENICWIKIASSRLTSGLFPSVEHLSRRPDHSQIPAAGCCATAPLSIEYCSRNHT